MKNNIYITANRSHSNTEPYYIYYIDFVENITQFDSNNEFIPCFSVYLNNGLLGEVFNSFFLKNRIVRQIKTKILYYEMYI